MDIIRPLRRENEPALSGLRRVKSRWPIDDSRVTGKPELNFPIADNLELMATSPFLVTAAYRMQEIEQTEGCPIAARRNSKGDTASR
jgi:hypothetical protein